MRKHKRVILKKRLLSLERRRKIIADAKIQSTTDYLGAVPLFKFMNNELDLPAQFNSKINLPKGANSRFSSSQVSQGLTALFLLGKSRISQIDQLLPEIKLAEMLNLKQFFSSDVAYQILERVSEKDVQAVKEINLDLVLSQLPQGSKEWLTIDFDTAGLVSRARQREGVKPGFCNGRKRPCLKLPLITLGGYPVDYSLEPGNENCVDYVSEVLKIVSLVCQNFPDRAIIYRHDNLFTSKETLAGLRALSQKYANFHWVVAVAAHRAGAVKDLSQNKKGWLKISEEVSLKEDKACPIFRDDEEAFRLIVVRKTKTTSKAIKSYGRNRCLKRSEPYYYGLVTNLRDLPKKSIYRLYHQRVPAIEFVYKDNNNGSASLKDLPDKRLVANKFVMGLKLLAYNIMKLYQQKYLPGEWKRAQVETVQKRYINVGGKNH